MPTSSRIIFLDAFRAFAILMMLQGHWISGLLNTTLIDTSHWGYRFWLYCRGFTAPAFFTITGWVFCFLLLKNPIQGPKNPRLRKGIKRGTELLVWGSLLRLNLPTLIYGSINPSFYQPDVLHIIGISLFLIVLIYRFFYFLKEGLGWIFLFLGLTIFIAEPFYSTWNLDGLPKSIAAYFIKGYGGVFYLLPWTGYVFLGTGIAFFFKNKYDNYRKWTLHFLVAGLFLIFISSFIFEFIGSNLNVPLLQKVAWNNYLFIRFGDVLVLLSLFLFFQKWMENTYINFIGSHTLELYVVHYFILYGSLTGYGFYKFFSKELLFWEGFVSVFFFLAICIGIVFVWKRRKIKPDV